MFGLEADACPAAQGLLVFRNQGMLQFMLETCDHKNNLKRWDKLKKESLKGHSICPRLPDHVFYGMEHSRKNVTLKEVKGICDQVILAWRILIGLFLLREDKYFQNLWEVPFPDSSHVK